MRSFLAIMGRTVAVLAVAFGGLSLAPASQAATVQESIPNSEQPLPNTARVMDGYIYGIDRVGSMVIVAGDFNTVRDYASGSANQSRRSIFAYDSTTGAVSQTFKPVVDGIVHAVFINPDGQTALIAGTFKTVNGIAHRSIARVFLSNGALDPTFTGTASSGILDMAVSDDEIIIGGWFDVAGGLARPRLAALNRNTGVGIPSFNFSLSGVMNPQAVGKLTQVVEVDISPNGKWLSVLGNQTHVNGQSRGQLALIDLDDYTLANWRVPQAATWPCATSSGGLTTYIKSAEFSPDSSYLVTGAMGAFKGTTALCDTVARFEVSASLGDVYPSWVDHTGGDSIFRVQVTNAAVYAGGHQRWLNNPNPSTSNGSISGDRDGPGAVRRSGMGALDPASGVPLSWYPNRDGARPQRGVEEITASDNYVIWGSDGTLVGGEVRQRIAAFDVTDGVVPPKPERITTPATIVYMTNSGQLRSRSFDGTNIGAETAAPAALSTRSWSNVGDSFLQNGVLTFFGSGPDNAYYSRPLTLSAVGPDTNLSTSVGYSDLDGNLTPFDQPYNVDSTAAADYIDGRIVYTKSNSSYLYYRGYSQQSGIIGPQEYLLDSSRNWRSSVSSMTIVGDQLIAAEGTQLVRYTLNSSPAALTVNTSSRTVLATDIFGSWGSIRTMFAVGAGDVIAPDTAITSPDVDGTQVTGTLTVSGTASDDKGVASVAVGVQNTATGLWLQSDGTFAATAATRDATLAGSSWSLSLNLPEGSYTVTATAMDTSANADGSPATRTVSVVAAEPDSTITAPAAGANLTSGPVSVSGTALDVNDGVAAVNVSVRNTVTNEYLQADDTFAATPASRPASLATPGAASTTWSLSVVLPDGQWSVESEAVGSDAQVETTKPSVQFTTATVIVDSTEPDTVVTFPTSGSTSPAGTFTVTGTATDDLSGVGAVAIAIRRISDGLWLRADGSYGALQWLPASLSQTGATSATWSRSITIPTAGKYAVTSRATDVSGNVESVRPFFNFFLN